MNNPSTPIRYTHHKTGGTKDISFSEARFIIETFNDFDPANAMVADLRSGKAVSFKIYTHDITLEVIA